MSLLECFLALLELLCEVLARQSAEIRVPGRNQNSDRSPDRSEPGQCHWIGQPTDPDRYSMLLYPPGSVSRPIQHDTVAFQESFRCLDRSADRSRHTWIGLPTDPATPGSVCRPIQLGTERTQLRSICGSIGKSVGSWEV